MLFLRKNLWTQNPADPFSRSRVSAVWLRMFPAGFWDCIFFIPTMQADVPISAMPAMQSVLPAGGAILVKPLSGTAFDGPV